MDYYAALGLIGIAFGMTRYVLYIRDIFRGRAMPHPFSWFVWGLMAAIVFFAQVSEHAGAGSWITGVVAVMCLAISVLALFKGEKGITVSDWACFFAALFGVVLWRITDQALLAVVIVAVADAIAYVPTYRKAFYKPNEEPAYSYFLAAMRSVFGILALQAFTITNVLYPASLVITDGGFVLYLLVRRMQLAKRGR
ncbi:MAG TPA: hypothetical protein VJL39_01740 [Candidatus Paceibacterota bacterium]